MEQISTNGATDIREEKKQLIKKHLQELILNSQALLESVDEFDDTEQAITDMLNLLAAVGRLGGAVEAWREAE